MAFMPVTSVARCQRVCRAWKVVSEKRVSYGLVTLYERTLWMASDAPHMFLKMLDTRVFVIGQKMSDLKKFKETKRQRPVLHVACFDFYQLKEIQLRTEIIQNILINILFYYNTYYLNILNL